MLRLKSSALQETLPEVEIDLSPTRYLTMPRGQYILLFERLVIMPASINNICVDCYNCRVVGTDTGTLCTCRASRIEQINYIKGPHYVYARCVDVNTDGKCPKFERRQGPTVEEVAEMHNRTVCVDCVNCETTWHYIAKMHTCKVSKYEVGNFVTGFTWRNRACAEVNPNGWCPKFEPRQNPSREQ